MSDDELLAPSDLNYIEFNRHSARESGGVVHDEDGLTFFVSGHKFPFGSNGVMRTDGAIAAGEVIERANAFFAPRSLGFTYCIMRHRDRDIADALEAGGVGRFSDSPGMALEKRLPDRPVGEGAVIERVADSAGVRAFGRVCGAAYATYGMPPHIGDAQFARDSMLLQPHVAAFLARVDGEPAAAAMVMVSHGVAGIYWVGTTPAARGRGLAEACTRLATNAGFDMGARLAALQASVMGEPIYLRMGYRIITRYPWYVVM
ncbi:MAG TPA: GNAT family N-acetyltransferase [Candidatus Binatia bacterium]|nr:GNAT family N-acetyltransferase [Candidatus Binatia bacterium]